MEDLFSAPASSQEPPQSQIPVPGQITPEDLERMKQQARELAVAQYYAQQQAQEQKPKVTYEINQPVQIHQFIIIHLGNEVIVTF